MSPIVVRRSSPNSSCNAVRLAVTPGRLRLSKTVTATPADTSRRTTLAPMNPAPPVTSTRSGQPPRGNRPVSAIAACLDGGLWRPKANEVDAGRAESLAGALQHRPGEPPRMQRRTAVQTRQLPDRNLGDARA